MWLGLVDRKSDRKITQSLHERGDDTVAKVGAADVPKKWRVVDGLPSPAPLSPSLLKFSMD